MRGFLFQWKDKSYFVESEKERKNKKDAEVLLKLWGAVENVEIDWNNKTRYENTIEGIKERMELVEVEKKTTDSGLEYWKYRNEYYIGTEYVENFFYKTIMEL